MCCSFAPDPVAYVARDDGQATDLVVEHVHAAAPASARQESDGEIGPLPGLSRP